MVLHLGLDVGSCGLRAARCDGEQLTDLALALPPSRSAGFLLCEVAPGCPLGVRFPGLKDRLRVAAANGASAEPGSPFEQFSAHLRLLREAAFPRGGPQAGSVVLTLPARYSPEQRSAVRLAARQAGFLEVTIISDSLAVALAHRRSPAPATLLVYCMGYAGFEMGLIRATRGHFRVLACDGGEEPGGATFDRQMLEGLAGCLRAPSYELDTVGWTTDQWLKLQRQVQEAKESLSRATEARLPCWAPGHSHRSAVQFTRSAFLEAVRGQIAETAVRAKRLLAEAGLEPKELDEIILSGGSSSIPGVAQALENALGRPPTAAAPLALAHGAAWYAAGQTPFGSALVASDKEPPTRETGESSKSVPPAVAAEWDRSPPESAEPVSAEPAESGPGAAGGLVLRARPRDGVPPGVGEALRHPQALLRQGQADEARRWIEALVHEAQAMLGSLPGPPGNEQVTVPQPARRALARAFRLLKEGRLEEGVSASHAAWQLAPNHPYVFEQMIEAHRQAAARFQDPAHYEAAQRWLACAYQHDQSNSTIRRAIADRHFLHAQQMRRRGRPEAAMAALELCLQWNPSHAEANAFRQSGPAATPNPPA